MTRLITLLLLTFGIGALSQTAFIAPVHAQQRSKKERKALKKKWKRIAKQYKKNPLALKAHEEAYKKQIQGLTQKNNDLTTRYTELQSDNDSLVNIMRQRNDRVDSLRNEYERMKSSYEILKEQSKKPQGASIPGLVFRVQVGAYEQFDMSRHEDKTGENFSGESVDNLNKYLMGRFRNYENARAFRGDIRKLGIEDAFVVAYNDGTRIDIKEALRMQNNGGLPGTEEDAEASEEEGEKSLSTPRDDTGSGTGTADTGETEDDDSGGEYGDY